MTDKIMLCFLGDLLRAMREEAGLTQKEVAEKLFVATSTVYHWENGKREPSFTMIERLANLYGKTARFQFLPLNQVNSEACLLHNIIDCQACKQLALQSSDQSEAEHG